MRRRRRDQGRQCRHCAPERGQRVFREACRASSEPATAMAEEGGTRAVRTRAAHERPGRAAVSGRPGRCTGSALAVLEGAGYAHPSIRIPGPSLRLRRPQARRRRQRWRGFWGRRGRRYFGVARPCEGGVYLSEMLVQESSRPKLEFQDFEAVHSRRISPSVLHTGLVRLAFHSGQHSCGQRLVLALLSSGQLLVLAILLPSPAGLLRRQSAQSRRNWRSHAR